MGATGKALSNLEVCFVEHELREFYFLSLFYLFVRNFVLVYPAQLQKRKKQALRAELQEELKKISIYMCIF